MAVIERPFIVKEEKGKEFLEAFIKMPSAPKEFLEECKKAANKDWMMK